MANSACPHCGCPLPRPPRITGIHVETREWPQASEVAAEIEKRLGWTMDGGR